MERFILTGNLLSDLLQKRNMTVSTLALKSGVPEELFQQILDGESAEVSENKIASILSALGIYQSEVKGGLPSTDEDPAQPPIVVEPAEPLYISQVDDKVRELPTFKLEDAPKCSRPYQIYYNRGSGEPLITEGTKIAVYPFVQGHFDLCLARRHGSKLAKLKIVEQVDSVLYLTACDMSKREPGFHYEILGGVVAFNAPGES